jgi:hypothetical protein
VSRISAGGVPPADATHGGIFMSAQPTNARPAKPRRAVLKAKDRPPKNPDHIEIVRMAAVEAASRAEERREMIATAAYFRAQKRGFEPGHELEDWFAAETEVARALQFETF